MVHVTIKDTLGLKLCISCFGKNGTKIIENYKLRQIVNLEIVKSQSGPFGYNYICINSNAVNPEYFGDGTSDVNNDYAIKNVDEDRDNLTNSNLVYKESFSVKLVLELNTEIRKAREVPLKSVKNTKVSIQNFKSEDPNVNSKEINKKVKNMKIDSSKLNESENNSAPVASMKRSPTDSFEQSIKKKKKKY